MTTLSCILQGRSTVFIFDINSCVLRKQQPHHSRMTIFSCKMEGRFIEFIFDINKIVSIRRSIFFFRNIWPFF